MHNLTNQILIVHNPPMNLPSFEKNVLFTTLRLHLEPSSISQTSRINTGLEIRFSGIYFLKFLKS